MAERNEKTIEKTTEISLKTIEKHQFCSAGRLLDNKDESIEMGRFLGVTDCLCRRARDGCLRDGSAFGVVEVNFSGSQSLLFFAASGSFQQVEQLFLGGPTDEIQAQHFDHATVRALAGPEHQQQGRDEHGIELDGRSLRALCQPVA